ncbi:hypothetical protein B0H10DRAFT_2070739 [Mycena sp. CBHHK59/15]|nr:hypothetical protein B0H10DRAFT_2070739 [Mycena sp. CBHHK59/15]
MRTRPLLYPTILKCSIRGDVPRKLPLPSQKLYSQSSSKILMFSLIRKKLRLGRLLWSRMRESRGSDDGSTLPNEILYYILEHVGDLDLIRLTRVSHGMREIALRTILPRYGITALQMTPQLILRDVSSQVLLHALASSYPTLIPGIAEITLRFTENGRTHSRQMRSLALLAKRFPPIASVTLHTSAFDIHRFFGFWATLQPVLYNLTHCQCGESGPVVLLSWRKVRCVRQQKSNKVWRSFKHDNHNVIPTIEEYLEMRNMDNPIHKSRALSEIQVRSFPEQPNIIGSLVVVDPSHLHVLRIDKVMSQSEWQFILPYLDLPDLKSVDVSVELDLAILSSFLQRHTRINSLWLYGDWKHLPHSSPPTPMPALLSFCGGSPRIISHFLRPPEHSRLFLVSLEYDSAYSSSEDLESAFHAMSIWPRLESFTLGIRGEEAAWDYLGADDDPRGATLQYVHNLTLYIDKNMAGKLDCDKLSRWLMIVFPALRDLDISNSFSWEKPFVVPVGLADAIKARCPDVIVKVT